LTTPTGLDWGWLAHDAIGEFKERRVLAGASQASASSYATGARVFVRYCRSTDQRPHDAINEFDAHLAEATDLSAGTRSDYRSHARAFVQFLSQRYPSRSDGRLAREPQTRRSTPSGLPISSSNAIERERRRVGPTAEPDPAASWLRSIDGASIPDLLAGYAKTLGILKARGVLRTANAPLGDYAEWLVWRAFGGTIEPNSTKSHDVSDATGRRLQVKARLVSERPTPGQLQTSVFRTWNFDFAVLVQLAERDYAVVRASMLPALVFDEGRSNAKWSEHVKGWAVFMTPALMGHSDAVDVTQALRVASAN
jgi:hypothetical protein